jgi:hypothetical protein
MKSFRFGSLMVVLLCCLVFACITPTEDGGDSQPTPDAWFPMTDGSSWRYLSVETDGSGAEGNTYSVSYTVTGTEVTNDNTYTLITDSDGNTSIFRLEDSVLYELPSDMPNEVAIGDFTLEVGESKSETLMISEDGMTIEIDGTLTCLGSETVVTPIGSFPDCKVFELRGVDATTGNTLGIMTQWLDREIGRVKFVEENYEDGVLVNTDTESVIYYNIVGGPSGGDSGQYDVSGKVVDPDGKGIAGITMRYMGGGDNNLEMVTLEDGSYLFEDQPAGPNWIGIVGQRDDYWIAPDHYEIEVIAGDFTVDDFVGVRMNDPEGSIVSGTITTSDGAAVDGVHITMTRLHGIWEEDALYGESYTLAWIPDGTYTIIPSREGYTFIPTERTITVAGSNVTADFEAVGGHTVTGRLVTLLGTGVADIVIVLRLSDGSSVEAISDTDGYYAFTQIPTGSYDIYNRDEGGMYSLTPHQLLVSVAEEDVTLEDISVIPTPGLITISGTILNSRGIGIVNGPITLYDPVFGIERITWADTDGRFTFDMLYIGTFTITPDPSPYTVSPVSRQVTVEGVSVSGVAFTFNAFSVSGRVVDVSGSAKVGITVFLGGVGTATIMTKTGADGQFTFTDMVEGDYTVQPEVQGYTFTPDFQWFQLRGGDTDIGTFMGTSENAGQ